LSGRGVRWRIAAWTGRGWSADLLDNGERCSDRNVRAQRNKRLSHDAVYENLDLDRALLCFNNRNDIAAPNRFAGLFQPFDEGPGFHIGPERGHAEF
jgi:hypothetical protein